MKVNYVALTGLALVLGVTHAQAQTRNSITLAEQFPIRSGFALETDDASTLSRLGCLEPLTRIDFDGKLQPSLSTSWTQTSPTTWEFTLRDNVKFHDGSPLNAEVAANALNKLLKVASPARAFSPKEIKSIEAVGDKVVRVTTQAPSVLVPYRLASTNTGILSPAAYKDGKINPVGTCTGPFIITSIVEKEGAALKRNDAYWGGPVALESATIRFIPDGNTRALQIRTGEAQVSGTIPAITIDQLGNTIQAIKVDTPRTSTLLLNNKKGPLADVKIRKAVEAAIDTSAIASVAFAGAAHPAVGPFSPQQPWAPKEAKATTRDIAKAKALLKEAGIAPGALKLGLYAYTEKTEFKDVAAIIQAQLKEVGIQVNIRLADYNALEPSMLSGEYDMALLSRNHLFDVADPIGYLTSDYTCGGSYNLSHYCNPELDAKVKKAGSIVDQAERHALYAEIGKELKEDAVSVWLVHEQRVDAVSKNVSNFKVHPHQHYALTKDVSLVTKGAAAQ